MLYSNTYGPKIIMVLAFFAGAGTATGAQQDLGVQGRIWAIDEPDMRLVMALEASGIDWASKQERLREQTQNFTATIDGWQIPAAEHTLTRYIDPSITIQEPIEGYVRQPDGSFRWDVLHPAGTTVNPLAIARPLTWQLLIDATSDAQLEMAEQIMLKHYRTVTLVLTRGDPGKLAKSWDYPVYFAQEQHFTRFGVTHTPSLVGVSPERPLELQVTHFAYPYQAELVESLLP